MAGVVVLKSD